MRDLATPSLRARALKRWKFLALPARDLYVGRHHLTVLGALTTLRSALRTTDIRLSIVSAGYGLLDEHDRIVPYDASFTDLSPTTAITRARNLGIHAALEDRLAAVHTAIFLLSEDYLSAIEAPFNAAPKELYFAVPTASLSGRTVIHIPVGRPEARLLHDSPRTAKATLFASFATSVASHGWDRALRDLTSGALLRAPATSLTPIHPPSVLQPTLLTS